MGVCVGVDADGQMRPVQDGGKASLDKSKIAGIIRENEIGMLIGFTEVALDFLSGLCTVTVGLRYRLQVSGQDQSTSRDINLGGRRSAFTLEYL